MNSPLKYPGGKSYLAKRIVALMPTHRVYCEPYFGGGSVLFEKDPEGTSEVVNDIDKELTNFWKTLRSPVLFSELEARLQATPFSETIWEDATLLPDYVHPIDRAVNFFVRCRQSLAGRAKQFALLTKNRTRNGMNEQASAWISAVDSLPEVHARLRRVVVLNRDALDVIRSQDTPETLFYLDPPYLHETRTTKDLYENEMTAEQHNKLLLSISGIKGKFILSGYPSGLYEDYEKMCRWRRFEIDIANHAGGGKTKRRMTECLWVNYDPSATELDGAATVAETVAVDACTPSAA